MLILCWLPLHVVYGLDMCFWLTLDDGTFTVGHSTWLTTDSTWTFANDTGFYAALFDNETYLDFDFLMISSSRCVSLHFVGLQHWISADLTRLPLTYRYFRRLTMRRFLLLPMFNLIGSATTMNAVLLDFCFITRLFLLHRLTMTRRLYATLPLERWDSDFFAWWQQFYALDLMAFGSMQCVNFFLCKLQPLTIFDENDAIHEFLDNDFRDKIAVQFFFNNFIDFSLFYYVCDELNILLLRIRCVVTDITSLFRYPLTWHCFTVLTFSSFGCILFPEISNNIRLNFMEIFVTIETDNIYFWLKNVFIRRWLLFSLIFADSTCYLSPMFCS